MVYSNSNRDLGHYSAEISAIPLLTREEVDLTRRGREGDHAAYEQLVTSNLRFVVKIANQFVSSGIPLEDLVQEGNVGLIKAAHKFDETMGFKFISYAVWWIRQSILHYIYDCGDGIVRVPQNRSLEIHRQRKFMSLYKHHHGEEPSDGEVAGNLGISEERTAINRGLALPYFSLDFMVDEDTVLIDCISNGDPIDPLEELNHAFMQSEIKALLSSLPDQQRIVLRLYFGIGEEECNLREIGDRFGCTRENIRQIKEKALKQLRRNGRTTALREYLGG